MTIRSGCSCTGRVADKHARGLAALNAEGTESVRQRERWHGGLEHNVCKALFSVNPLEKHGLSPLFGMVCRRRGGRWSDT